mgnify:CR=1 FL=1
MSIGKIIVVYASGDHRVVDAEPDLLPQLQRLVGGWIEIIKNQNAGTSIPLGDNLRRNLVAAVNEEGLLQDVVRYNGVVSYLLKYPGLIAGDAVLLRAGFTQEGEPDVFPLTDEDASRLDLILQLMWSREVRE